MQDAQGLYRKQNETGMLCGIALLFVGMQHLMGGTYYEGQTIHDRDSDVDITILRWGSLDAKTDRMIGQIASANYEAVTLVFEYALSTQQVQRLTINTGTHIFGKWRELGYWSPCTYCGLHYRAGADSTRSKGAKTTGGCFFVLDFPRIGKISKMRLVNVLAAGKPVKYMTKFNISCDLMRSPMQVPFSKSARAHMPEHQITDVEPPVDEAR